MCGCELHIVKKAYHIVDREVMVEYLKMLGWDDFWVRCLKEIYGKKVFSWG